VGRQSWGVAGGPYRTIEIVVFGDRLGGKTSPVRRTSSSGVRDRSQVDVRINLTSQGYGRKGGHGPRHRSGRARSFETVAGAASAIRTVGLT